MSAGTQRLRVLHETRYDYAVPVTSGRHLLHLTPRMTQDQRLINHACRVSPTPGDIRADHDFFGNAVCRVSIDEPHGRLDIVAESLVEVRSPAPARDAPSPTVDAVRAAVAGGPAELRYALANFLGPSPLVPVLPEAAAYARDLLAPDQPWLAGVLALAERIHGDFEFDPGATTIATPLREVLARRRGVCQDFAHLLTSCLRSTGLPARYVSGYVLTTPPPGQPRLLGADASHAWVSAWCPGLDWVAVDPTNARFIDAEFVTLGWGRDFGDVTPTRGTVAGGGGQVLTVRVTVAPEAG